MSAFDGAALPGRIPTSGAGAKSVNPASLFSNIAEKEEYRRIVEGKTKSSGNLDVKSVKVEIFDLSDASQRRRYEKLWASLLVKVSRQEAVVESSRDLVKKSDGTSYWMKYVEYVEFGSSDHEKNKGDKNGGES